MPQNPVAQRIQNLLDQRDEKLKTVADKIGVGYYSVYPWWQREHAKADAAKVRKFADYFDVPVEHLLYGDPLAETGKSPLDTLLDEAKGLTDERKQQAINFARYLKSEQDAERTPKGATDDPD